MTEPAAAVRDEFDRLAALPAEWGWNDFYHPRLARALPASPGRLLEAGCGTGAFARFIAPRCGEVLALDLSPRMLEQARSQPVPPNVRFEEADLLTVDLPAGSFDAAVSIAALHHMDLEAALGRFAELLRPGGRLAILDLHRPDGPADRIAWALGALAAPPVMFVKSGRLFPSRPAHEAWAHHAIHDRFMRLAEVRERAGRVLPGCEVRRHLFWRYSLLWSRP